MFTGLFHNWLWQNVIWFSLFFLHNTASMQKLQRLILGSVECTRGKCTLAEGSQSGVAHVMHDDGCRSYRGFYFSLHFRSGWLNVVQKWSGENRLDRSQRCDLILLQVYTFLYIELHTVYWCGVVNAMRDWIWVTSVLSLPPRCHKVLYCSAEPISPCLAFPAGETRPSVVLRSVSSLVVHWGSSALTLNISLTQTEFYLVFALFVRYNPFSKAQHEQSVGSFF